MSGHSKWSTIKHAKAATDAKRGKLFTKLAKEIIVASRQGGPSIDMNIRLRMAVQKAKDNNMPNDNIDRAIKKGSGELDDGSQMVEILYEGYGPGGTAIILETLSDNKNRTVSDIRSTLTKAGGNLAQTGSVAWQFDQKGVIVVEAEEDQADEFTLVAIDAGAEDFDIVESTLHIYSAPEILEDLRKTLTDSEASIQSSELAMIPNNTVQLDDKAALQALRLLDRLEDLDDVQRVFSNADFSDEAMREYSAEA